MCKVLFSFLTVDVFQTGVHKNFLMNVQIKIFVASFLNFFNLIFFPNRFKCLSSSSYNIVLMTHLGVREVSRLCK